MSSSKQQNGELSLTEGAESASLQEESSRTDGCIEKDESSKDEHPNVTVIVDGPDDGAASDSTPQSLTNHTQRDLSENSKKPSDPHANQVGSNTDQDYLTLVKNIELLNVAKNLISLWLSLLQFTVNNFCVVICI